MIKIYDEFVDNEGMPIKGRRKLFIKKTDVDEENNIINFSSGILLTPQETGYLYIVDDYLIEQIHKVKLIDNQLVLKDGEEIVLPVKTDLEIQEEELEKQLAELRAKKEKNNIE